MRHKTRHNKKEVVKVVGYSNRRFKAVFLLEGTMKIGDRVRDVNGYEGTITDIFKDTGQIQVQQKPNVWCTYDNYRQLTVIN